MIAYYVKIYLSALLAAVVSGFGYLVGSGLR